MKRKKYEGPAGPLPHDNQPLSAQGGHASPYDPQLDQLGFPGFTWLVSSYPSRFKRQILENPGPYRLESFFYGDLGLDALVMGSEAGVPLEELERVTGWPQQVIVCLCADEECKVPADRVSGARQDSKGIYVSLDSASRVLHACLDTAFFADGIVGLINAQVRSFKRMRDLGADVSARRLHEFLGDGLSFESWAERQNKKLKLHLMAGSGFDSDIAPGADFRIPYTLARQLGYESRSFVGLMATLLLGESLWDIVGGRPIVPLDDHLADFRAVVPDHKRRVDVRTLYRFLTCDLHETPEETFDERFGEWFVHAVDAGLLRQGREFFGPPNFNLRRWVKRRGEVIPAHIEIKVSVQTAMRLALVYSTPFRPDVQHYLRVSGLRVSRYS